MTFSKLPALLTRWLAIPEPSSLTFTNVTDEHLRALSHEHSNETRRLVRQNQPAWNALAGRTDPEADIERRVLGPEIVERKALVRSLSDEIAKAQENIRVTKAIAADYERRANEVRPWVAALIAALPSDPDLERAFKESQYFERASNDLLRRTGDRRAFRRPIVDPYRALREALEDRLRKIERLRLLRSVAPLE
jgi:hypothetical protein